MNNFLLEEGENKLYVKAYDLDKDLSEKNDLSSFDINKALELELLLDNYLKQVGAPKWKPGIHWRNKPIKLINSFH